MAPPKPLAPEQNPSMEHEIDRTPEFEEFIAKLKAFHEERGTTSVFDPEPRMGLMNVDLLKLFNKIVENGGYDKVSEEKLKWRSMCEALGLSRSHNAPADAYTLKQIFYKNLAAYEIKMVHKQEPPPPEILEFVTAKGGGLLSRTLENFGPKGKAPGHQDSDRSGDDATPSQEHEAPSSGRASRGLREAPPQRVPFTPDTSTRSTRHASNHHNSGTPTPNLSNSAHMSMNSHGPSPMSGVHIQAQHPGASLRGSSLGYNPPNADLLVDAVSNYQPTKIQPIQLRIVDTPSSNPEAFARKQRMLRKSSTVPTLSVILRHNIGPTILDGPNIYERCMMCLRSGKKREEAFALHHLVKISFERGDKFRFIQFPGLIEGLTEKALEVGRLFYQGVDWRIVYDPDQDLASDELDGVEGTTDILEKIADLEPRALADGVYPAEMLDDLVLVTEAVLTIRNMVMMPENARFVADLFVTIKDLLCILLSLPSHDIVTELKHSALDIAEQLTPHLLLEPDDPLYQVLLSQLSTSNDRGTILTALRAIGRIAMNSETETNKLDSVPPVAMQRIMEWLLLNDDELLDASLDFLYQYTAVVSNLESLVQSINMEHLVQHLVRLLAHGAKRVHKEQVISPEQIAKSIRTDKIVPIPHDLLKRLLAMEEPERCYTWLRCFFAEDADLHITQIAIWQAYTSAFQEELKKKGRSMIGAAEFIRNISQVYQNAGAQIVRDQGPTGEMQRFIIKGIRPRSRPVSPDGREYLQCLWSQPAKCGHWLVDPAEMRDHILKEHLNLNRQDGVYMNEAHDSQCHWDSCTRHEKIRLMNFMIHINTHVMAELRKHNTAQGTAISGAGSSNLPFKHPRPRMIKAAKVITLTYEETAMARDERNPSAPPQAAGIPLSATLILRNIARNIVKTKAEKRLLKQNEMYGDGDGWNERLFRLVRPRLYEIMTENRLLGPHIASLIALVEIK